MEITTKTVQLPRQVLSALCIPANDFRPENTADNGTSRVVPLGNPEAARKAREARRVEWALLPLRQTFADESYMRGHLKAAGIRAPDSIEPATVTRLRSLLRRAGLQGEEFAAAVGTDPAGYLAKNPDLPLWAAVALVLEAVGRFTPTA